MQMAVTCLHDSVCQIVSQGEKRQIAATRTMHNSFFLCQIGSQSTRDKCKWLRRVYTTVFVNIVSQSTRDKCNWLRRATGDLCLRHTPDKLCHQ